MKRLRTVPRRTVPVGLGVVLLSLCVLAPVGGQAGAGGAGGTGGTARASRPPNIVLITTDDQRLSDLAVMPETRKLIARRGVTFAGISNHPLCCPARAQILTGQFAQNNGVRTNNGRYGGYKRLDASETIASWLRRAGYRTAFMGKYLNGYASTAGRHGERGWDSWDATVGGTYNYINFRINHNGRRKAVRGGYQTDYFTDLAARRIHAFAGARAPFFLWQSYVAPHKRWDRGWNPPVPADRHANMFRGARPDSFRDPGFNERDMSDKTRWLASRSWIGPQGRHRLTTLHRERLRSLQAVDEGVAATVRALRSAGQLRNTVIIFSSDNGFMLGEHRYTGKTLAYEQSLRVPLLMRGPGVPVGVRRLGVGATVDLAPTIVAVAGARAGIELDGRNLLPIARGQAEGWETLLVQGGPRSKAQEAAGWFYRGVRTDRYTYLEYPTSRERELYDRRLDPHELRSVHGHRRYRDVEADLAARLALLRDCSGEDCRTVFAPPPQPAVPAR